MGRPEALPGDADRRGWTLVAEAARRRERVGEIRALLLFFDPALHITNGGVCKPMQAVGHYSPVIRDAGPAEFCIFWMVLFGMAGTGQAHEEAFRKGGPFLCMKREAVVFFGEPKKCLRGPRITNGASDCAKLLGL